MQVWHEHGLWEMAFSDLFFGPVGDRVCEVRVRVRVRVRVDSVCDATCANSEHARHKMGALAQGFVMAQGLLG